MTPEYTPRGGKVFPVDSSLSGITPEYGGIEQFPASSKLDTGTGSVTPEYAAGKTFPLESQVNP
jgi:hypothetical protein